MKNIINYSSSKENFKENLLKTIKNKIFSLIESGKEEDELTLLESWEENYPKWAKENLRDFFGTIVINEEKKIVRVGNLVWDLSIEDQVFDEGDETSDSKIYKKNYFTQEQAKKLEKDGYRLPKEEDVEYTISYMPGNNRQEQINNFLELLGKPFNGFYNLYGNFFGNNKIACFWLLEEESYCVVKKNDNLLENLDQLEIKVSISNPNNLFPIFLVKDAY